MGICYIVGAGDCTETIHRQKGDLLIAADGGADHLARMGITPDLLLGDLDSHTGDLPVCPILQYPKEKDDSDLALAVEAGAARGYREFVIFGALGGARLDHTLAAVHMLPAYAARGLALTLVGGGQRVRALCAGEEICFPPSLCGYISLYAIGGADEGVSAENLKYPLTDATLQPYTTLGLSNEFLPGKPARISLRTGIMLLVWQEKCEEMQE